MKEKTRKERAETLTESDDPPLTNLWQGVSVILVYSSTECIHEGGNNLVTEQLIPAYLLQHQSLDQTPTGLSAFYST